MEPESNLMKFWLDIWGIIPFLRVVYIESGQALKAALKNPVVTVVHDALPGFGRALLQSGLHKMF